jgi:hypothetical protein
MISVQCSCGAKYQAKESRAGKSFACQKCGNELIVPATSVGEADFDAADDELPALPTLPKKPKKKAAAAEAPSQPAKPRRPEQRAERESAAASWGGWTQMVEEGDIRGVLVAGFSIFLGVAAIAFPFLMGPLDPKDLAKDPNAPLVNRNERTGAGIILAMHNLFGQWGVIALFALVGLAFIAGGVWYFRVYEGESD